jgi:hypothetical protein
MLAKDLPAHENYDLFQKHLVNLSYARRFTPERFLFRVDAIRNYVTTKVNRDYISAPSFAPLAYPAFIAGNPCGPTGVEAQLRHCGGRIWDRDRSSYISCSRDLLWCLWFSTFLMFRGKQRVEETKIYLIGDSDQYNDIQTNLYDVEYWENIDRCKVHSKIKREARKRAIRASEVLVHREISRERIIGVLQLKKEIVNSRGLRGICMPSGTEKFHYMKTVAALARNGGQEGIASLAEWCEENIEPLKCIGRSKSCFIRGLFKALFLN